LADLDVCTLNPALGYCDRKGGCECERQGAREYWRIEPGKADRTLRYYGRDRHCIVI